MASLRTVVLSLIVAVAHAVQEPHHHNAIRQTDAPTSAPTAGPDYARISSLLGNYISDLSVETIAPSPTVTLGISVPSSLRAQIVTAVPATVIIQLVNPNYRESVAADFAAGNTPGWYESLSPELKTYFESIAGDIRTGTAVYTVTPPPTTTAPGDPGEDPVATTSSDVAMPTGASRNVVAGAVGMAGVLAVALAL